MDQPLEDTWDARDLPVLRAAVRGVNSDLTGIRIHEVAEQTGLDEEDVLLALRALENAGLVELKLLMPARAGRVLRVSGTAQQLAGAWPTPELGFQRMIKALQAIAADGDKDDDTRSRARQIVEGFVAAGRDVGVSVAAAVITGQVT